MLDHHARQSQMSYRAKPGGWFVPGTLCHVIADCGRTGVLMSGLRLSEQQASEGYPVGAVYEDEELCPWEEFELLEDIHTHHGT